MSKTIGCNSNELLIYGQLICDKGGKNIQGGEDSLFNKWCWKTWTYTCETINLEYFLIHDRKINSKWIQELDIRPEIKNTLEENIGSTLFVIGL